MKCSPLQGGLPGSIALRGEVQTIHHLHILICQLDLSYSREVVRLDLVTGPTLLCPRCPSRLPLHGGGAEYTHNHSLQLLVLLAEAAMERQETQSLSAKGQGPL